MHACMETISGRGTLFQIIRRDEAIRRVKALIFECAHSLDVFKEIYKRIKKNQKEPEKRGFIANRLQCSAIEFLSINRYLDEKDSFYILVGQCFNDIVGINQQLAAWEQSPETIEEWFLLPRVKKCGDTLKKFRKELDAIQKKLTALY